MIDEKNKTKQKKTQHGYQNQKVRCLLMENTCAEKQDEDQITFHLLQLTLFCSRTLNVAAES